MKIKVVPLKLLIPRRILNSLCKVIKIFCQKIINREGNNQNIKGKNKTPKIVLSQLIDKERILVEGSKIEKRFIIIFIKNLMILHYLKHI